MKHWIYAARLRTLPLSLSGIILGGLIAAADGFFDVLVFCLALFTTLCLQILSNFANDYGDGIKGTDAHRTGEARMVSSGLISPQQMKKATILFSFLSFFSAFILLVIAFLPQHWDLFLGFIGLAVLAVLAAIFYTVGKSAYGYRGLGDLFVFLFFGLVAVVGTHTLFAKEIHASIFLPATAIGLLSTAVLNLNNMRDAQQDKIANKITIPLMLGHKNIKIYHFILLFLPFILGLIFLEKRPENSLKYLFLLLVIPTYFLFLKVSKNKNPNKLDKELIFTSLLTLSFALLFGFGLLFG
ncbi:1,4-dihydroxy-2-naphthoate octaprenyltransferase [Candidatus Ornithobacterium hominis]|uniref:1,4-dihydroxy-2-naphthoate octaprenyltransferase n=1 Tax=Candidatus Ornithobacterium hominis TaxID=2497989 RepID=A0A383U2S6_9FLAO|nr:1,4-dihydroxy-2-naphthoate octaprenyltransferase [Candidatus Ornithobacterium hominis]MCT7905142.1 1,4-dihydroxy-2-naphthoate octaprenyltransferase [Candidatus Ornithobacterium hominis]SZD74194.1 1,4-dihydroxy-2-naphthoate octaprenyltransferase [Candidatus Ornithobacterium hominis]